MGQFVTPGKEAGELIIQTGAGLRKIKQTESREDDFFDTVDLAAGLIAAGTSLDFFKDLEGKKGQHTNLKRQRQVPSGSEFFMNRVGLSIGQAVGNLVTTFGDTLKVSVAGEFKFRINQRLITEGPLMKYQSGYGMTGAIALDAGAAPREAAALTTGVPSAAAAPQLLVVQPIKDDDDLSGEVVFNSHDWLTGAPALPTTAQLTTYTAWLHGVIKTPLGK